MKKFAAGVAALVVGVTLSSLPASAQGRNPNDGGPVSVAPGATPNAPTAPSTPSTPYYGRNANDGGTGPQPSDGQLNAAAKSQTKTAQKPANPVYGRNPNDGGTVQ